MQNPSYRYPRQSREPTPSPVVPTEVSVSEVMSTISVTGSFYPGTQTVSVTGSVTVTQSTTSAFVAAQVTVTASATQLFALNGSPNFREVANPNTTSTVFIGPAGVTITTGHALRPNSVFDMAANAGALFGVVSTGSITCTTIGW